MKKFFLAIGIISIVGLPVFSEEVTPQQKTVNNQSYFTANIQKQPQNDKQKQGINNHFTFFTINVQVNGKIDNITPTEK